MYHSKVHVVMTIKAYEKTPCWFCFVVVLAAGRFVYKPLHMVLAIRNKDGYTDVFQVSADVSL